MLIQSSMKLSRSVRLSDIVSRCMAINNNRRLSHYINQWRFNARSNKSQEGFKMLYKKTAKLRRLMEKKLDRYKNAMRRKFTKWRLMNEQRIGFANIIPGKIFVHKVQGFLQNRGLNDALLNKVKNPMIKHKSLFPACIVLDSLFKEGIESHFSRNKDWALKKLKLLFQFEHLILGSGQSLLIRTIRLREDRHVSYYNRPISKAYSPADIRRIFTEKAAHLDNRYDPAELSAYGNKNYFNSLMSKMKYTDSRLNRAGLLITGSCTKPVPYLRFRETYMVNVLRNNYMTNLQAGYLILLGFKNRANAKLAVKDYFARKTQKFKAIWGRLFVKSLINLKLRKTNTYILSGLRINSEISNLMEDLDKSMTKEKHSSKKMLLSLSDVKNARKMISQSYAKIKKTFANDFLNILLDTHYTKQELKKQLKFYIMSKLLNLCAPLLSDIPKSDDESDNLEQ